jgi:DNA-directed RNA polymerase specialized sigma subunit
MQEIGKVLELTLSRISQLHTKAILHLRAALQSLQQDQYAIVG